MLKPISKRMSRNPNLKRILIALATLFIMYQTYSSIYSIPHHFKKLKSRKPNINIASPTGPGESYLSLLHQPKSQRDRHNVRVQLANAYPYDPEQPIPRTIWQTWKTSLNDPRISKKFKKYANKWIKQTEDDKTFQHQLIPDSLTYEMVDFLYSEVPSVPYTFRILPKSILRADFLRYLLLFARGGIYSDMDTTPLQPPSRWVAFNETLYNEANEAGLVIGIEADPDREDWAQYYAQRVQFCQWSMISKVGHPLLGELISRIVEITLTREKAGTLTKLSKEDGDGVMYWTGPGIWTKEIFKYFNELLRLNQIKGNKKKVHIVNPTPKNKYNSELDINIDGVDWRFFTLMDRSVVFGDVLVLPITSFSPGVGHMGSKNINDPMAYIRHMFEGSWKPENEKMVMQG